jgi:rhamnosyltransferase
VPPHVRVLLATYNGALWLDEQIQSIVAQQGVRVSVIASDDASSDQTPALLDAWSIRSDLVALPCVSERFGSAHRNFLRLIRDTPLGDADYFALADQDDIWLANKLLRGIDCLRSVRAHAYSSNVTAFWADGSKYRIDKAQPQRSYDYLFGSPGPGCTFVFPRLEFVRLQRWVTHSFDELQAIWVHDWLIYAFIRSHGMRWHIDHHANMLYRQHGSNEVGVNAGWAAALSRVRHVRCGAYRKDILAIADAVGDSSRVVAAVRRLALVDRFWLIGRVRQFRRRLSECLILAIFIFLMPRDPRS